MPSGQTGAALAMVALLLTLAPPAGANPKVAPAASSNKATAAPAHPDEAGAQQIKRQALPQAESPLAQALNWLSDVNEQDKSTEEIRNKLVVLPGAHASGAETVAPEEGTVKSDAPQLQSGDFDGDGRRDLVVVLPAACGADCSERGPRAHAFIIWGDRTWSELATGEARSLSLLPQGELTGDGLPDIGLSVKTCGAHTCFKDARIFASAPNTPKPAPFQLIFDSAQHSEMATAKITVRVDKKPAQIILSSGDIGSAGAGSFQRNASITYTWQPQSGRFSPGQKVWETSNLRLHRFQDALNFWAESRLTDAQKAFTEVIDAHPLKDLPDAVQDDARLAHQLRRQLGAVAHFELGMLAAAQDDAAKMERILKELQADAPQSPATAALGEFVRAWRADGDLRSACQRAAAKFPQRPDDTWVLDAIELGYNAPVKFDASGLCVGH